MKDYLYMDKKKMMSSYCAMSSAIWILNKLKSNYLNFSFAVNVFVAIYKGGPLIIYNLVGTIQCVLLDFFYFNVVFCL